MAWQKSKCCRFDGQVVMGHCERERTKVYFQPVAKAASALPEGKSIVSPLPFEPPR